jgi:hypothetical protein
MEELILLINLFKTMPGNVKSRLFHGTQDNVKMMYDFMENVHRGKFKSDEEASRYYFKLPSSCSKYYALKKRLRSKLLSWILSFENPYLKYEEFEHAFIVVHKLAAQVAVLRTVGIYLSANKIDKLILKISLKFELPEFGEKAARNIRDYYAYRERDHTKFNKYNQIFEQLRNKKNIEFIAGEVFSSFMVAFHLNDSPRIILGTIVSRYTVKLEELLRENSSNRIRQYINNINIITLISENNFNAALIKISENLKDLEKIPYRQNTLKNELLSHKIVCYLNLRQYDEGKKVAEELVFLNSSSNEINLKKAELKFLLALQGQFYEDAAAIFHELSANGILDKSNSKEWEKWELYKIYLYFLFQTGEISGDFQFSLFSGYRQARFFNSVPNLNKDKSGMNISILAIEFILNLIQGKFDKITDKYEALLKYSYRYLKNQRNIRSLYFIKLLLLIPNYAYNWNIISDRSKILLERFSTFPLIESPLEFGAEIIPYDILWKLIEKHTPNRTMRTSGEQ